MADIRENQKEVLLDYAEEMNLDTGLRECPGVDAAAMTELPEYVKKKLDEVLAAYIDDDRNYVVDGASIQCSEAAPGPATLTRIYDGTTRLRNILYSEGSWKILDEVSRNTLDSEKEMFANIFFGLVEHQEPKKLFALHATQSSDNGIRFATVVDRTCLRDIKEGTEHLTSPIEGELSSEACIVSCGNCGILKESDIDEIEKRLVESIEYGTCYSLIKPIQEWTNAYNIESIVGNRGKGSVNQVLPPSTGIGAVVDVEHHNTKKFSTEYGPKEGLTMLSTLLCKRGGVITIKVHGQIYLDSIIEDEVDIEARIEKLMKSIEGNSIDSWDEMKRLSTVEILARVIYQEARGSRDGQNAVMFSIINRLFSGKNFTSGRSASLYNILRYGVYTSITMDNGRTPNGHRPPDDNCNDEAEIKAWENAKRLAAITVIALEDYGSEYEDALQGNDSMEKIIESEGFDNNETYKQIVDFIQQQENSDGDPIENEIKLRDSIVAKGYTVHGDDPYEVDGNIFFTWKQ